MIAGEYSTFLQNWNPSTNLCRFNSPEYSNFDLINLALNLIILALQYKLNIQKGMAFGQQSNFNITLKFKDIFRHLCKYV